MAVAVPLAAVLPLRPGLGSPDEVFDAPPGHCPKCVALRQHLSSACPHCGLHFQAVSVAALRPPESVAQPWRELLESWDQPAAHDRVLAALAEQGELAAAGRLYRIALARTPDDLAAQRGQEEVRRRAVLPQVLSRSSEPSPPAKTPRWVTGVGLVFLLLFGMAVMTQLRSILLGAR